MVGMPIPLVGVGWIPVVGVGAGVEVGWFLFGLPVGVGVVGWVGAGVNVGAVVGWPHESAWVPEMKYSV